MTGIGAKVAHVRSRMGSNTDGHHCHWTGCINLVPPAMWGCKAHWYKLPADIRSAIWATYRQGQEDSKTPSRAYVEAARRAEDWIAANHPPKPKQETLL